MQLIIWSYSGGQESDNHCEDEQGSRRARCSIETGLAK